MIIIISCVVKVLYIVKSLKSKHKPFEYQSKTGI